MSENKMDDEQIQAAEPVEPVLNTIDFTDELADEALDRENDTRFCNIPCPRQF